MAVRSTVASLLARALEPRVKEWIREASGPAEDRLRALEEENEKLKKKLGMATGAVQAATAELMKLKGAAEESRNLAGQAMQRATSALAAAEAAAEGVTALELHAAEQVDLDETSDPVEAEEPADPAPDVCLVPGCGEPKRAKGYCAKHYQQWKRGTLVPA